MQYNFTINEFEGPLDLLLHLIQRHEIDLYDIPVAAITEQYLLFIHTMKELQLDVASEYLVMAATLIEMKSRMLLPRQEIIEEQLEFGEIDPREELMNRLIEYKKYKEAAKDLKEKEQERGLMYSRSKTDLSPFGDQKVEERLSGDLSLYDMLSAFQKMMRRKKIQKPLKTKIARQEVSIERVMEGVLEVLLMKKQPISFFELFEEDSRENMVVTFLAILELMKKNEITVFQEGNFDELYVKKM